MKKNIIVISPLLVAMLASCTSFLPLHMYGGGKQPPVSTDAPATPYVREEIDFNEVAAGNGITENVTLLIDDYDNDGAEEAYVLTGKKTEDGFWSLDGDPVVYETPDLWFIDSNGNISYVENINYYAWHSSTVSVPDGKFAVIEASAGGSSSLSYIYSCNGEEVFIPQISGISGGFGMSEDGRYVYYANDFSKGFHDYVETELFYDENTREFIK